MRNLFLSAMAVALMVSPIAAHADEWHGVHPGYYFSKGETIDAQAIAYRDTVVRPHCKVFAQETSPDRARAVLGHAVSQGVVGGAGAALSTQVETEMLNRTLIHNALPAVGVASLITNALFGGLTGNTLTNERMHSGMVNCIVRDAGGIYSLRPSDAKKIASANASIPAGQQIPASWTTVSAPAPAPQAPAPVAPKTAAYTN